MEEFPLVDPKLKVHTFQDEIADLPLYFQFIFLKQSLYLWIGLGGEPNILSSLNVAYPLPGKSKEATASTLLGSESANQHSQSLARHLTMRLGQPCFVSCNLPNQTGLDQLLQIERRALSEIAKYQPTSSVALPSSSSLSPSSTPGST